MSWSIHTLIGSPENICKQLDKQYEVLSGLSQEEFGNAITHIKQLILMNFNPNFPVTLQVSGHGHGQKNSEGSWIVSNCTVKIEQLPGTLV